MVLQILLRTFAVLASLGILAACGPRPPDIKRDDCYMKMNACENKCNKSGLEIACTLCCHGQASKCDEGADYSFASCTK